MRCPSHIIIYLLKVSITINVVLYKLAFMEYLIRFTNIIWRKTVLTLNLIVALEIHWLCGSYLLRTLKVLLAPKMRSKFLFPHV